MIRWRIQMMAYLAAMVFAMAACGSEDGADSNNDWGVGEDVAFADADAGPDDGDDADHGNNGDDGDADREDADPADADLVDADPSDADPQPDSGDPDEEVPFTVEGMSSAPWYGVSRFTVDPAITGAVYKINFREDMTVAIGFYEEVTGKWEIFGEDRVRLYDLERDGQPNQPPSFAFDVDTQDDNARGLELYLPDGPGGSAYVLRLERLATPDLSISEVQGRWQSEQSFTDQNDNSYRMALRMQPGYLGYGIYNGAYIEYSDGAARIITYDTGETFWFIEPPNAGDPKHALAGEIMADDNGEWQVYVPRNTNPGEEPAEFDALLMEHVEAFGL